MHLKAFSDLTPQRAREFIVKNRKVLTAVRTAPFPTIAAINGHCLGTGLGLALVSDIRIAVPHATFGLPEIKVGVRLCVISPFFSSILDCRRPRR
jgi:enoyl-CoA hydratase/carnithine racemase